ncbi:unnamed protein product, partial [Adineta ricciae]
MKSNPNHAEANEIVKGAMLQKVIDWGFPPRTVKYVKKIIDEWYAGKTMNGLLDLWEAKLTPAISHQAPLNILTYNVEGWGSRDLETIEMIANTDSSICVLTEVGEQWNKVSIPHFKTFYQKGTNLKGGVIIAVGKHLKATRVDIGIENTAIVDIEGLSERIRIIGIYWPQCQNRNLNDLKPFIDEKTIITGDFNAGVESWDSPKTDARGRQLEKWIEENNLIYIPGTRNSSKRSERNIDFVFTNISELTAETLEVGSSDHWPIVTKSEDIGYQITGYFPIVNWTVYEIMLQLMQDFWTKELALETQNVDNWYSNYTRFLSALKKRVTNWRKRDKFRPSLPPYIIQMLKSVRQARNKYYRDKKMNNGIVDEETRLILRKMTSNAKKEIVKYKSGRWKTFLSQIQEAHDVNGKAFWSHLSKIYKPRTLPISKLLTDVGVKSNQNEIKDILYDYYNEQAKSPEVDHRNNHDQYITRESLRIKEEIIKSPKMKLEPITQIEIKRLINKLKNKKSAGYDEISNHMIKLLPPGYIQCLTSCFNMWIEECRFPEVWKTAKIVTLNKLRGGIPRTDQTRPISLLPTHSKIFEKILLNRTREWAEGNQLIPNEQSGFRPGGLLPTRVLSIYQEIKNNLAANMPTLAIYVDYQKAYDKVWHDGLIVKLRDLGIPINLLTMIVSWLNCREAYINLGENKSEKFNIDVGLPQGAHSGHLFADDLSVL